MTRAKPRRKKIRKPKACKVGGACTPAKFYIFETMVMGRRGAELSQLTGMNLSEAKRLHKWLGCAIKYLEQKK